MKIALVADVHSNAQAFSLVLNKARLAQADALLFAGDLIGYYFQPVECLKLLMEWEGRMFAVRGNHEEMLLEAIASPSRRKNIFTKYGPGIELAINHFTESQINWISLLRHPLAINCFGCSILLCHGSPENINKYFYPDSCIEEIFSTLDVTPDVLILGHTHYPFVKQIDGCLIINPGSVGQPRNRIPGAHWALLDTQMMDVNLFVEPYDTSALQKKCVKLAPGHPYLREVLVRT